MYSSPKSSINFFYQNRQTFGPSDQLLLLSTQAPSLVLRWVVIHHQYYYQQGCGADRLVTFLAQSPPKPPVPDLLHPFDPVDCHSLLLLSTCTKHQISTPDLILSPLLANQPRLLQKPPQLQRFILNLKSI